MTENLKIARNSLISIVSRFSDALLNFILAVLLAKYFGRAGFGTLSFFSAFFFLLSSADTQWLRPILVREISASSSRARLLGNGLLIRLLVSVSATLFFWVVVWASGARGELEHLAFLTSLSLLLVSVVASYEMVFQATLKMQYLLVAGIIYRLLALFVALLAFFYKADLIQYYALSLLPQAVWLFVVRHYSARFIKPEFSFDPALWKNVFREAWPLALSVGFIFIYHRFDQLFLFKVRGPDETGLYSCAVKIAEGLNILPVALAAVILPAISRCRDQGRVRDIYSRVFKYLLAFIIPVAFAASVFSGKIIPFFYGKDFFPAGKVLGILVWAEVFVFCGIINSAILVASGKQRLDPFFTGISAGLNIFLNLWLIPVYGFTGAAIASLVSYAAGPVAGAFVKATRDYSLCMLRYSLRPLAASFCALLAYIFLPLPLPLLVFSLFTVYITAMYFTGGIDGGDLGLFARSLGVNRCGS